MSTVAQPTLLIMAAGMASRYGGLKQLDTFGPSGETLLDYAVYDAMRSGFGKVVFIIRRTTEATFTERVFSKYEGKVDFEYVFQELDLLPAGLTPPPDRVKPWGTAHAVWVAASQIKGPFAVMNGDDFYGRESFRLMADFLRSEANSQQYGLVGYPLSHTLSENGFVSRGICVIDSNGYLQSVAERFKIGRDASGTVVYLDENEVAVPLTGQEIVSMNLMGFAPSLFSHIEELLLDFIREQGHEPKSELYLPNIVNQLVQTGKVRVKVLPTPEQWFGVTFPTDKEWVVAELAKLVKAGVYPEKLWA